MRFILLAMFLCVGLSNPAQAFLYQPRDGEVWEYDITFRGDDVGDVRIAFSRGDDGDLTVKSTTEARIKVAFVTVFRMESEAVEVWRGRKLQAMSFNAETNGEKQWGRIQRQPDGFLFSEGPNGSQRVAGDMIHIANWTPYILLRDKFLRPLENDVQNIKITPRKWEYIEAESGQLRAKRFSFPADEAGNQTDVWYDKKRRFARMVLNTPQAVLSFERRAIKLPD